MAWRSPFETIVDSGALQAVGWIRAALKYGAMPLAWQPCTTQEIEQTRLRRHIRRLEQRLRALRAAQLRFVYRHDIAALEKELADLQERSALDTARCA